MTLPDFEKLFLAAVRATSLSHVTAALASATQSASTAYEGEPRVIVKKDSIVIHTGGGLHIIFGEQRAIELLIQVMLEMDDLPTTDLQILSEAMAQVDQAKAYAFELELQKANLVKIDADEGFVATGKTEP